MADNKKTSGSRRRRIRWCGRRSLNCRFFDSRDAISLSLRKTNFANRRR